MNQPMPQLATEKEVIKELTSQKSHNFNDYSFDKYSEYFDKIVDLIQEN